MFSPGWRKIIIIQFSLHNLKIYTLIIFNARNSNYSYYAIIIAIMVFYLFLLRETILYSRKVSLRPTSKFWHNYHSEDCCNNTHLKNFVVKRVKYCMNKKSVEPLLGFIVFLNYDSFYYVKLDQCTRAPLQKNSKFWLVKKTFPYFLLVKHHCNGFDSVINV